MFARFFTLLSVLAVIISTQAGAAELVGTRSIETAPVVSVQSTRIADVVFLGAGFAAGLRQGMVLNVTRNGVEVAEVILVDLRPLASAALILKIATGQSIQRGDQATVKTLKA